MTSSKDAARCCVSNFKFDSLASAPFRRGASREEPREAQSTLETRTDELDSSLSLLTTTLESTIDGIVALDLSGKILFCNTNFTSIWQFPEEILKRWDFAEMMAYVAEQAKDSEGFLQFIQKQHVEPEAKTFDVVEMKDNRTFERHSFPHMVNGGACGHRCHLSRNHPTQAS
jgi:PAS domain-containing protein